jgi:hypothetical protein
MGFSIGVRCDVGVLLVGAATVTGWRQQCLVCCRVSARLLYSCHVLTHASRCTPRCLVYIWVAASTLLGRCCLGLCVLPLGPVCLGLVQMWFVQLGLCVLASHTHEMKCCLNWRLAYWGLSLARIPHLRDSATDTKMVQGFCFVIRSQMLKLPCLSMKRSGW